MPESRHGRVAEHFVAAVILEILLCWDKIGSLSDFAFVLPEGIVSLRDQWLCSLLVHDDAGVIRTCVHVSVRLNRVTFDRGLMMPSFFLELSDLCGKLRSSVGLSDEFFFLH